MLEKDRAHWRDKALAIDAGASNVRLLAVAQEPGQGYEERCLPPDSEIRFRVGEHDAYFDVRLGRQSWEKDQLKISVGSNSMAILPDCSNGIHLMLK